MKKLCLLALSLVALVQAAAAIPAFARKYGYSCEVCHAPVPRLKAFGEQFMDNGYRIPDKEPPRATVDTGDPLLLLQRELPLAMRFDGFLAYAPNNPAAKSDFQSPVAMKILSAGNLSDKISYYTYFLMSEDAKIVGLEDTYLSFRGVFGLPVDIVFGQYRITDPVKPSETRLTAEGYAIFGFRVGDSRINLSYDRGIMASTGTAFGTDVMLQLVNGNGIDEQDIFDSDKYKSFVYRVAQSFWKDNLRLGILGYSGKEAGANGLTNSVSYFGPDLRLRLPKIELLLEYVRRTDSNPLFLTAAAGATTDAFLAEAMVSPWGEKGRTFFTFAWNKVDSSLEAASWNGLTVNVNYLLRRNLKWVAEYTHDLLRDNHRLLTGIVTAF
ncbi:MAG: hypothetical protein NTZ26_09595 [Candidatus Aminicenantes bacterium]|nr:hypothetical protein [Candidatus Aminicenantes bacterium]